MTEFATIKTLTVLLATLACFLAPSFVTCLYALSPGRLGFDEWVSADNFFDLGPVGRADSRD